MFDSDTYRSTKSQLIISSLMVLFAIGLYATPDAFAATYTVENAAGSSTPGCEPDCFIPATLTISPGDMVTFVNNDSAAHVSLSGSPADGSSGVWDSSLVMMNSAYTTPALDAGEYPYFCIVHPWMTGLIIVDESGTSMPQGLVLESLLINNKTSIHVMGHASSSNVPVTLSILSPNGNIVAIIQTQPDSSGFFDEIIDIDGPLWNQSGTYLIKGKQGSAAINQATIEIYLTTQNEPSEPKLELQITRGTIVESQNNSSYLSGDTISVSGTATGKSSSTPVVITLFSPNDNVVLIDQFYPKSDGSYSITIGVGGAMWHQTGNYNVEATYGSLKESEKFYFTATIKIINAPGSSTPGCEPDCFVPSTLRVAVGDDIEFLNPDTAAHTTTSGTPGDGPDGEWDSGLVMPGSSYYVLIGSPPGTTLPYFCMVHPWMTGKIIVEGSTSQSESSQAQDDATERIAAAEAAVAKAEEAAKVAEAEAAARIAEAEAAAKIAVSEAAVKAAEEAARAAEQISEERIAAVAVNEKIEISMDFTNDSDVQQSFALIVQIKDSNNTTISLSHVTGMLGAGQTLDQVLSYTPTEAGTYTVEKFLWDNFADPSALTDSKETFSLTVS